MAALAAASLAACASTPQGTSQDAGPDSGNPFGCCPDVQTSCLLRATYGPKKSARDDCRDGYDGDVPAPGQPGWTHGVDAYGCGVWTPPPNAVRMACGVAPEPVPDAGDASTGDAGDASDGGVDAPTD